MAYRIEFDSISTSWNLLKENLKPTASFGEKEHRAFLLPWRQRSVLGFKVYFIIVSRDSNDLLCVSSHLTEPHIYIMTAGPLETKFRYSNTWCPWFSSSLIARSSHCRHCQYKSSFACVSLPRTALESSNRMFEKVHMNTRPLWLPPSDRAIIDTASLVLFVIFLYHPNLTMLSLIRPSRVSNKNLRKT